ncbi:hypothetical protein RIF23_08540 [Lipingzhangella sp. LS1_29]|uniref:FAD dependent oxidoreductase domain-containing protein n=1 Tax=Lipingzhangella rawalii TaxID=2055835 RepID=A0ABU2H4W3_9ACTN|nr:hypothetical protein [Lipingzhangella rawalii]MDS1270341.1 hypothetical protein [Lipingzhangella rawalii]
MPDIGIVGSGVAGLHLGLYLRQHDVPVTIYSDRSPQQIAQSWLPNSVAHHHVALERERALKVEQRLLDHDAVVPLYSWSGMRLQRPGLSGVVHRAAGASPDLRWAVHT